MIIVFGREDGCDHNVHRNSCGLQATFTASQESVSKHNMCCATFASWALQNVGVMPDSAHTNAAGTLAQWIADNLDTKQINPGEELKPGDFLCYGNDHIDIVGEEVDGGFVKYNGGHYVPTGSQEFERKSCIEKIAGWPNDPRLEFALRINWGDSEKNEGSAYEGFKGNEAVVSPVTGVLLEYGTYDKEKSSVSGDEYRVNVDKKYGIGSKLSTDTSEQDTSVEETTDSNSNNNIPVDKVGYAKILVLDKEYYEKLEKSMLEKTRFQNTFLSENGKYSNDELKVEKQLNDDNLDGNKDDSWSDYDKTLYGYKEFARNYEQAGIDGYIVYIDGFKCELPDEEEGDNSGLSNLDLDVVDDSDNADNEAYSKIFEGQELTIDSFKKVTLENLDLSSEDQLDTKYERAEEYKLASKEATDKLNAEETVKEQASTSICIDNIIFIKEGTVIGRTLTDRELVEKVREDKYGTYEEVQEARANIIADNSNDEEDESSTNVNDAITGNYIRIIMKDLDDTVIENVEDYMKLDDGEDDEKKETQIDWEFWYFSVYEGGGWDGEQNGPEAVKDEWNKRNYNDKSGTYNYDAGIIQWTTNGGGLSALQGFCGAAAELDSDLCGSLASYADKDYSYFDNQSNMTELQNKFTEICDKDRDAFLELQINIAKYGPSGEAPGGSDENLAAYWTTVTSAHPWIEERPLVVQGSCMAASVANGNVPPISDSMSDEEVIQSAINSLSNSLESRKIAQTNAALDILENNFSEVEIEDWVRTGKVPNGATRDWLVH